MSADAPASSVNCCVETVTVGCFVAAVDPEGSSGPITKIVNVSGVLLTLERVSLCGCCTLPRLTPNDNDEGDAAPLASRAALRSSNPAPACWTCAGTPGLENAGAAVLISSDRYCATLKPGRAAFRTAAAPATIGDDKLVPSTLKKPLGS